MTIPYWGDGGRVREPVLAEHPDPNPPKPFVTFDQRSGPNGVDFCRDPDGVDFCRDPDFGFPGHAFVALFGDLTPVTTRLTTPSGFKVVRVDINTGEVSDFAVNKVQGPASKLPHRGFERPSHCQFGPDGALYVVDFGQISIAPEKGGIRVQKGTGAMAHPSYGRPSRATPIRAVVVRPPTPSKRRPGQPPLSSRGSSCVGCSKGRTGMMPRSGPSSRRRRHLLNLTERKDET